MTYLRAVICGTCGKTIDASELATQVQCNNCGGWTWTKNGVKVAESETPKFGYPPSPPSKRRVDGQKDDVEKDRFDLIPPKPIAALARILTFGAKKYGPNNWRGVEIERYVAALHRHLNSWQIDPTKPDEESGESHLAHALCCIVFLMELEQQPKP